MALPIDSILPAVIGPGEIVTNSTLGLAIDTNVTAIDGGKITTGIVQSSDGGTFFNLDQNHIKMYNAANEFTLDSTAAGDTATPNIQGAYIKGGTIEGTSFSSIDFSTNDIKVRADSVQGNYGAILSSDSAQWTGHLDFGQQAYTGVISFNTQYVGVGYDSTRLCSDIATVHVKATNLSGFTYYYRMYVQVSYNNTDWTTLTGGNDVAVISYNHTFNNNYNGQIYFRGLLGIDGDVQNDAAIILEVSFQNGN